MSTEYVNALMGYEYFLKMRGKASVDEINLYLKSQGWKIIHQRTYDHYRSLLHFGFRSYIPINQFDVSRSLGRIQMAADRRRYEREDVEIHAQISPDKEEWIDCMIVNRSIVGFGLTTNSKIELLKGSKCWLRVYGYYDIPVVLVWSKNDKENRVNCLGFRAFEFVARYEQEKKGVDATRLTGIIKITRKKGGDIEWRYLFLVLSKTDELIGALSDLIITIDDLLQTDLHIVLPVLVSIKFGSPGELQTKVDLGLAEILKILIEKFQYWALEKRRYIEENRKKELENVNNSIEILRNALHLRQEAIEAGMTDEAIKVILDPIKKVFDRDQLPKELFDEGSPERGILSERVMPVLAELLAGDDADLKVEVIQTDNGGTNSNASE